MVIGRRAQFSSYRLLQFTHFRTTSVLMKDFLAHLNVTFRIDCCLFEFVSGTFLHVPLFLITYTSSATVLSLMYHRE